MINRVKKCKDCTLTEHCFSHKGCPRGIIEAVVYIPKLVKDCAIHDELERALKEKR